MLLTTAPYVADYWIHFHHIFTQTFVVLMTPPDFSSAMRVTDVVLGEVSEQLCLFK